MMYLHTLEAQEILQQALCEAHHRYSDAEIARNASLNRAKMTVQRFRTAKLKDHLANKDRLKLDYRVAEKLWNFLASQNFIEPFLRESEYHTERFAANAMSTFYRAHESQTRDLKDKEGLQTEYFCYKPSFRRPGYIIKSLLHIDLRNNEYFKIMELQQDASTRGGLTGTEISEGFGFCKSGRLWLFMREETREQPRIFCFHKRDIDRENGISRWLGYILESDKRYSSGVFNFRVGLSSRQNDEALWAEKHPDEAYDAREQIDNVPYPRTDPPMQARRNRVVFDADILDHIEADVKAGIDQNALD